MTKFELWKQKFQQQELTDFSLNREALLWLKIKSIIRKETLADFLLFSNIAISSTTLGSQFIELFDKLVKDIESSHRILDQFISKENQKMVVNIDINTLISELYKLQYFQWGGDYNNSLDKYLVSHYVKAIKSYDLLQSKFKTEIDTAVRGYVLNSWYNHWSSILIENIFKSHPLVLPTVGQIKSVDFFINDIPFDLKVTYLPNEYQKMKRKEKNYPVELTYLKRQAKLANIHFDPNTSDSEIFYEITERMKDKADAISISTLATIQSQRKSILQEAMNNPSELAKWLYENQGEMRFGSENRLFLVLVDTVDWDNSWKLKRNFDLLQPAIYYYLNNFRSKNIDEMKLSFTYKTKEYNTYADILFVTK